MFAKAINKRTNLDLDLADAFQKAIGSDINKSKNAIKPAKTTGSENLPSRKKDAIGFHLSRKLKELIICFIKKIHPTRQRNKNRHPCT